MDASGLLASTPSLLLSLNGIRFQYILASIALTELDVHVPTRQQ